MQFKLKFPFKYKNIKITIQKVLLYKTLFNYQGGQTCRNMNLKRQN